jgi:hypothetical protein
MRGRFWAKRVGLFRDRPCLLHFEFDGLHVISPVGASVDILPYAGMLVTGDGALTVRVSAGKMTMKLLFSAELASVAFLRAVEA